MSVLYAMASYTDTTLQAMTDTNENSEDLEGFDDFVTPWDRALDSDRNRGFFTKRDREYLHGKIPRGTQKVRDLRYRIRSRVRNGLLDTLVLDEYPNDELQKILDGENDVFFAALIENFLKLAYRIHKIWIEDQDFDSIEAENKDFERLLEIAVSAVEFGHDADDTVGNVDADLSIERKQFEERVLRNKIVAGNARREEVISYLSRGDLEKLYSELEALDRDIELVNGDTWSRAALSDLISD